MSNICLGKQKYFIIFKIWNLELFMQLLIVSSDLNVNFRVILDGKIRHTIYTLEHMVLNIFSSSSYSNPCSIWPLRIILKYFSPIICRNIFIFIPWTKVNSYDSQYSIHLSSVKRIIKSEELYTPISVSRNIRFEPNFNSIQRNWKLIFKSFK